MLAGLLRGLIGGSAARGAMGGGASGLLGSIIKKFGKKGATGAAAAPQGAGAQAAKPQISYSQMMSNMGDRYAYQEQQHQAQQQAASQQRQQQGPQGAREQLAEVAKQATEAAKSLGALIANASGLKDAVDVASKAMKGDLVGAIKSSAKMVAKMSTAIIGIPMAIKGWGERILEQRRELSQYSGQSAHAFAKVDAREMLLNVRSGQARGESTANLAQAIGDIRDELRPIEDMMSVMTTKLSTMVVVGGTLLAKIAKTLTAPLRVFVLKGPEVPAGEVEIPLNRFLEGLARRMPNGVPGANQGQRPPLPPVRRPGNG